MEENLEGLCVKRTDPQRLLFGSFTNEDYDRYFDVATAVHPSAVEFFFDRQNYVSDWINQGTWFQNDLINHKLATTARTNGQDSTSETEECVDASSDAQSTDEQHVTDGAAPLDKPDSIVDKPHAIKSENTVNNHADNRPDADVAPKQEDVPEVQQPKPAAKPTSWAALFKKPVPASGTSPVAVINPNPLVNGTVTTKDNSSKQTARNVPDEVRDLLFGQPAIAGSAFSFQLRGLTNSSNWCFINATLQALMSSPKFYSIYSSLPKQVSNKSGLLTKSVLEFMRNFSRLNADALLKKAPSIGVNCGMPFEPQSIYNCLPSSKSSLSEKGRQQDAEEFLSFLLNGLHDELVSLRNELYPKLEDDKDSAKKLPTEADEKRPNGYEADDEWHHVGPRNRSALTRATQHEASLITSIFGGTLRSSVRHSGAKESATLQPFFTLPLDVQADSAKTVTDALRIFFAKETLQGYTCQKTNAEVDASRKTSLESLPTVLILHLKYFLYDQSGGCQKILKPINIAVDLSVTKDMVSPTAKSMALGYTLFAVVYHHGKNAADGHYTAAVRDRSTKPPHLWVHCDDSSIEPCSVNDVIHHTHGRTPYLLFYERTF